jgi:hypothetical protein
MSTTTKRLLVCGVIGGPLFVLVAIVQILTRPASISHIKL